MTHNITAYDACAELAIEPPRQIIPDGRIHRFGKDKSHWYVSYGEGGCVGSYKGGFVKATYHQSADGLTERQQRDLSAQITLSRAKHKRETEARQAEAAQVATAQYNGLSLSGVSGYLTDKKIRAHGVRFGNGFIAVPLRDSVDGGIYSLQLIYDDHTVPDYMRKQKRNKTFIKGGRKSGCFHFIGDTSALKSGTIAVVCEGYATAASIHLATRLPVLVAFDCGNLAPVVKRIMQLYPALRLVIAADDDRWKDTGNAGVKKAHAAAGTLHSVILPRFASDSLVHKPTDFNDLHVLEGLHHVKAQWQQALFSLNLGGQHHA